MLMSERASELHSHRRPFAISGGTFLVLELHFKSSSAEMSNQTRAARRKVLVEKPQEHYVRLQFMPKPDFFFFSVCVIANLKVRI